MRARLFAKTGEYAGKTFELAAEATIGRAPSNSIVLADPLISSRHSRIFFDEAARCYRLEDLQSRNHTFLAGVRVRGPERLDRLDVITFGGAFDFIFQVLDGEAAAGGRRQEDAAAGTRIDLEGAAALPPGLGGEGRPPTLLDLEGAAAPAGLGGGVPAGTLYDVEGVVAPPGLGEGLPGGTLYDVEGVGLPPGLGAGLPAGTLYDVEGIGLPPGLGAEAPAGTRRDPAGAQWDPAGVSETPSLGAAAVSPGTSFDLGAVPLLPPGLGEPPPPPAAIAPAPPPAAAAPAPPPAAPAPPPAVAATQAPSVVAAPEPPTAARSLGPERRPRQRFELRVERQDGSVELVELAPGDNWVGRAPTCTVSIDDPTLSRRHARLVVGDDGVRVVDPGSTNHTYVGDAEVPAGVEVEVALGAPLLFGSVKAVLALAEPRPGQAPERTR
jgi:pSer/pThr/pTyr-binding forkhead associated (FHA) protein